MTSLRESFSQITKSVYSVYSHNVRFPLIFWAISRLVIFTILFIPTLTGKTTNAETGYGIWTTFAGWDGVHYLGIARLGYEYFSDGKGQNIVFFPMLPFLIKLLSSLGIPAVLAGIIICNLSFLLALIAIYDWISKYKNSSTARWVTAALSLCPFSLFTAVIYSESLFILFTTLSLKSYHESKYFQASLWGSFATATRLPGILLLPAFWIAAKLEGRPFSAYLSGFITNSGIITYGIYCWMVWGDPIAFIHNQSAWNQKADFPGQLWLKMMVEITAGSVNWEAGYLKYPGQLISFLFLAITIFSLFRIRKQLNLKLFENLMFIFMIIIWLVSGSPLINFLMVWGSLFLFWLVRNQLNSLLLSYGFLGIFMILCTGRTASVERYAYGIVVFAITLGLIFEQYPTWGRKFLIFFFILLSALTSRFANGLWAG